MQGEAPFDVFYLRMLSLVLDLSEGETVSFDSAATAGTPVDIVQKLKQTFKLSSNGGSPDRYLARCIEWLKMKRERDGSESVTYNEWGRATREIVVEICTGRMVDHFSRCSPEERNRHLNETAAQNPLFVRQLEILKDKGVALIPKAVTHYCSAMLNHQKWFEDELYTKDQLRTYEDDLKAQHAAVFNRAKSAEQTDEDRGYETLLQCQAQGRSLMLGNTKPEGNMAEGTLHRLADEGKDVGWHPNWTALLHTEA